VTQRRQGRRSNRGYTLVELMMALALLTVAVLGIISLQKITVVSNAHSKNVAMAQRIAQAWAGQLQMSSTEWVNSPLPSGGLLNDTKKWQRPLYNDTRSFGAAFDALGNPLPDTSLGNARFCTHVRMSPLYPTTMSVAGNGVLRAEIRVFWLRDGEAPLDTTASMCAKQSDNQARDIGLSTGVYHFVYQTIGIRQHYQI
jgi:prepilin-type N-terminal cleavage/methylation domain-containing protein